MSRNIDHLEYGEGSRGVVQGAASTRLDDDGGSPRAPELPATRALDAIQLQSCCRPFASGKEEEEAIGAAVSCSGWQCDR